jgi:hypothetical protein
MANVTHSSSHLNSAQNQWFSFRGKMFTIVHALRLDCISVESSFSKVGAILKQAQRVGTEWQEDQQMGLLARY